jgi:hypothetical protein
LSLLRVAILRTEEIDKDYWTRLILYRIDPDFRVLEDWLKGGKNPMDFETAVTIFLNQFLHESYTYRWFEQSNIDIDSNGVITNE